MQQFRPIPPYQQIEKVDMTNVGAPIWDVQSEETTGPQPTINSPFMMVSGPIPLITAEQLEAISGITPRQTDTLSLTDALKSTMSPNTTGRMVVIPGAKKRKKAQQVKAASSSRMNRPLRHTIIIIAILLIAITTSISLAPLADGQSMSPLFTAIGNWVRTQQMNWQFQSHNNTAAPVQNNNPAPPPMTLPKSQYVAIAQQDAIAVGISPDYFVRQINAESGFNPNAVSPAGALGIAQFLPGTAAGLGINPLDPVQALRGAAKLMANYAHQYGGDYAKALAAYNAGGGTVQSAVNNCGANWLNCLPGETRQYIRTIMGI